MLNLQQFGPLTSLLIRNARLLAEAREASQAKTRFLNVAAHELRTPVSILKGYLSLITDGVFDIPEKVRDGPIRVVIDKVEELDQLVEEMLFTSRLGNGMLPPQTTDFDACAPVIAAVKRARRRADAHGAKLEIERPEHPVQVEADPASLGRILDHLLKNALTYGAPPAEVRVEIRLESPVDIAVTDRGYGIEAKHHERVFDSFFRVDNPRHVVGPGAGLGLAISRQLATLAGAR